MCKRQAEMFQYKSSSKRVFTKIGFNDKDGFFDGEKIYLLEGKMVNNMIVKYIKITNCEMSLQDLVHQNCSIYFSFAITFNPIFKGYSLEADLERKLYVYLKNVESVYSRFFMTLNEID